MCIILVSLQLHKGMHDLDSKKKSKTEKTKVNVRKALCPVGIFCKLGLETVANLQEIRTDSRTGR